MTVQFWQPLYREFCARHAQSPHLKLEPLYALPEELLRHILEQIPNWLAVDEWRFEQDLQQLCDGYGVIAVNYGEPIGHPNLVSLPMPHITEQEFRELGWDQYATQQGMVNSLRLGSERLDPILKRQEAYLGWLLTNPQFRTERDGLRTRWETAIAAIKRFPAPGDLRLPQENADAPISQPCDGQDVTEKLRCDFQGLYDRWQLFQLHTWDLPSALGVNLGGLAELAPLMHLQKQPAVQAPSFLRLPTTVSAQTILAESQGKQLPENLQDWRLILEDRHPSKLNYLSFQRIFRLHFYRDVVLARRYSDRFHGQIAKLDSVFAAYFGGLSTDSVRRLRRYIGGT